MVQKHGITPISQSDGNSIFLAKGLFSHDQSHMFAVLYGKPSAQ